MTRPNRSLNRDWPMIEAVAFGALAAGSAADPAAGSETQVALLPNLLDAFPPSSVPGVGVAGELPNNRQVVRLAAFAKQGTTATAGVAANYADLVAVVYRFQASGLPGSTFPQPYLQGVIAHYSMRVNTTLGTGVTGGATATVTPPSMTGILPGMLLAVGASNTAAYEYVRVLSTTSTTFTAFFANTHLSSVAVTSILPPNGATPFSLAASGVCPSGVTAGASVTAGADQTVTPAGMPSITMIGIHVGDTLLVDTVGSGVQEKVVVTAVTLTTFTATFANAHGSSAPIVTASDAYGVPLLANGARFTLQPGDLVKLTRLSNNVTGLATPAGTFYMDWVPAGIGQ